jgi:acyl-coenzyme A synthetase/AMP-(fatty) acid ligase
MSPNPRDFVPELARSETGKLYKRVLRDSYWAGHRTSIA